MDFHLLIYHAGFAVDVPFTFLHPNPDLKRWDVSFLISRSWRYYSIISVLYPYYTKYLLMVDFPTPETQKVDKQNIANQMTSSKLSFIGFPGEIYRKPMAFTMVLPWNLLVSCRFSQENGVAGPLRRFAGSRVSPPKEPGSSWASQLKGLISKQSPSRGAGHRYDITFVHCTHTHIYIYICLIS